MTTREALEVLGLPDGASQQQAKHAYRALAKTLHPDLHQNKPEQECKVVESLLSRINTAWEHLEKEFRTGIDRIYPEAKDNATDRAAHAEEAARQYAAKAAHAEQAACDFAERASNAEQRARNAEAEAERLRRSWPVESQENSSVNAALTHVHKTRRTWFAGVIIITAAALGFWLLLHPLTNPLLLGKSVPIAISVRDCPAASCKAVWLAEIKPSAVSICKQTMEGWSLIEIDGPGKDRTLGWTNDPDLPKPKVSPARPLGELWPEASGTSFADFSYRNDPVHNCQSSPTVLSDTLKSHSVYGVVVRSDICPRDECSSTSNFLNARRYLSVQTGRVLVYVLGTRGEAPQGVTVGSFDLFVGTGGGDGGIFGYPQVGDLVLYGSGHYWYGYVSVFEPVDREAVLSRVKEIAGTSRFKSVLEQSKVRGRSVLH